MPDAVIVDTVRTPIGRAFKGSLASLRPEETGAYVVDQLLECNPEVDPALVEDVFCGVGMPQGLQAFNIGRIISLLSEKLPQTVNGVTVSRYCSSSLDAIRHAGNAIKAGEGDVYIAAGVEWVSRYNERTEPAGVDDRNPNLIGENGQPNAYIDMGLTAVNVAEKYEVSRADMDKYAQRSQELAVRSQEDGFFDREIVPVKLEDGTEVSKDDGPRPSSTLEKLSELPEAFGGGGVTAGNFLPAQRRRRGGAADERHQGQGAGGHPAGADRHRRDLGQRAGVHGRRPDRRDQEGPRPRRDDDRGHRRGRAQRGLRRPGDPVQGRVRHPAREAQHPRRRDRPRPPVRDDRRPDHEHPAQRDGDRRPPGRARDDVRRRRAGEGNARRAHELRGVALHR